MLRELLPDSPELIRDLGPGDSEPEIVIELLGRALWDVFSDNHTVVGSEGTAYDLGSFRASGDFIAEVLNERYPWLKHRYMYLDFYLGGALVGEKADLMALHRWIFARLRAAGCDWIYAFPRIYIVDFSEVAPKHDDGPSYDPSEAVRAELEGRRRRAETEAMTARLDEAHEEAVRRARDQPLPATVAAYREVFGMLPDGWPHADL